MCEHVATANPQPDASLDAQDLQRRVQAAMTELPLRCQQAFYLCRYEELKSSEIATKLGISQRMVQKHVARALQHLHERLQ